MLSGVSLCVCVFAVVTGEWHEPFSLYSEASIEWFDF